MPGLRQVDIHPDGEHGKIFDFSGWLGKQGFGKLPSIGSTSYGGLYEDQQGKTILLNPKSGRLDVVARTGDSSFVAETKGGVINTRHSGKTSHLQKGLCEAVGMIMQIPMFAGQEAVRGRPADAGHEGTGHKDAAGNQSGRNRGGVGGRSGKRVRRHLTRCSRIAWPS